MRLCASVLSIILVPHLCSAFLVPFALLPVRCNGPKVTSRIRLGSGSRPTSPMDSVGFIDIIAVSTEAKGDMENVAQLKADLKRLASEERYSEAATLQERIRIAEEKQRGSDKGGGNLEQLRARLADCVANEQYAEAAELQERIEALTPKSQFRASGGQREQLKSQMQHAAESGDYALAAQLQDEIKEADEEARSQLTVTRGPMQTYKLRKPSKPAERILTDEERTRENEEPDYLFYEEPKMTLYVDMPFAKRLQKLYSKRVMAGAAVLDLGAACATYLPEELPLREVSGLGMNMEEMQANEELTARVVHDLNEDPALPYMDQQFDAVLCSNALPYLTEPERVLEEAARVLRPGGVLIISFTDRCLSSKVTRAWSSRGNLDRATLVQELVSGCPGLTAPELIWEVNPMSSAGVMVPGLRGAVGGDPFIAVVAYRDAPPPGWALQVAGESSGALGTVQAGPFKGVTPFAAMYMLYLLINHAH